MPTKEWDADWRAVAGRAERKAERYADEFIQQYDGLSRSKEPARFESAWPDPIAGTVKVVAALEVKGTPPVEVFGEPGHCTAGRL